MARATARVARTIHGDVEHWQLDIVRATLAVALAMIALEVQLYSWQSFTNPNFGHHAPRGSSNVPYLPVDRRRSGHAIRIFSILVLVLIPLCTAIIGPRSRSIGTRCHYFQRGLLSA